MAIGLAAMAGFHFEENFKRPYSSLSIREFWRRWHISLSSWFRDYLYIPLGGNKCGKLCTYRNLLIVFILCGLWHGANFTFIIWGLWHGLFLILERTRFGQVLDKLPKIVLRFYAGIIVLVGWVFFRSENFTSAIDYLQIMFSFKWNQPILLTYHMFGLLMLAIGLLVCVSPDRFFPTPISRKPGFFPFFSYLSQTIFAVFSVIYLILSDRNPFIYFNF